MGSVTDIVKQYVPASYRAMVGATNAYYSHEELQALADYVKFKIFSTVVAQASEAVIYDAKERQFLGILTTLQFIPAAIDFWSDQYSSEGANSASSNKSVGYFDHRSDLWKIFDRLTLEAKELGTDLGISIYAARGVIPKVSYGDNGRNILVTSDPFDFPSAYEVKTVSDYLPWGRIE